MKRFQFYDWLAKNYKLVRHYLDIISSLYVSLPQKTRLFESYSLNFRQDPQNMSVVPSWMIHIKAAQLLE